MCCAARVKASGCGLHALPFSPGPHAALEDPLPSPLGAPGHLLVLARQAREGGTLWLNVGDVYASKTKGSGGPTAKQLTNGGSFHSGGRTVDLGVPDKNLVGVPWMLAFALRADGWLLRSDIIWHKPNVMPESVTDRPTKAHEHVFLLARQPRYFYDQEAIREPAEWSRWGNQTVPKYEGTDTSSGWMRDRDKSELQQLAERGKNARDVWSINTQPVADAHFATMPEELAEVCIKAGCPESGVVLDPFAGASTTPLVAKKLNRRYVGIELNPDYAEMARARIDGIPYTLWSLMEVSE
jgi:DNA modification methylase